MAIQPDLRQQNADRLLHLSSCIALNQEMITRRSPLDIVLLTLAQPPKLTWR
jgi:hypothetical protein